MHFGCLLQTILPSDLAGRLILNLSIAVKDLNVLNSMCQRINSICAFCLRF